MSAPLSNWETLARDKAMEAAAHLLGSCEPLHRHYEEWQNDKTFCAVLDSEIALCNTCDWWVEAHEVDDDGDCADCAPDEDD